jgi:hypothetical protein
VLLAEAWNGTRWRIQATPSPAGSTGSEFLAVSCSAAPACTAAGATTISTAAGRGASGGTSMTVSLAERWNGTAVGDTAGQSMIGVTLAMTTAGS